MRATIATEGSARVTAGSTRWREEPAPPTGQPVQPQREDHDQHQARPEDRHREPEQRAEARHRVEERVRPHRGGHAGRDARHRRDDQRRHRQLQGGRPGVGQLGGHRTVLLDRAPEVAPRHAADVVHVADERTACRGRGARGAWPPRPGVACSPSMRVTASPGSRSTVSMTTNTTPEQHGHGEQEAADHERQHPPPPAGGYLSSQVFQRARLYSTGWMVKPFTLARVTMISLVVYTGIHTISLARMSCTSP